VIIKRGKAEMFSVPHTKKKVFENDQQQPLKELQDPRTRARREVSTFQYHSAHGEQWWKHDKIPVI